MLTEREYQELKKLRALGFNWLKSSKDRTVKAYTENPKTGMAIGIVGSHPMDVTDLRLDSVMYKNKIFNITTLMDEFISKLLSKQKVEIPQFVADWIEECKKSKLFFSNLNLLEGKAEVKNWIYEHGNGDDFTIKREEMVIKAYYDGYVVEKEKLYTVTLSNGSILIKDPEFNTFQLCKAPKEQIEGYEYKLTQFEIESVDPVLMQLAEEVEQ